MPHIHDKIDFTSEVFIVYKNSVLLRKHDKYGIWLSVGGHIELDEDPVEAAIREVKEEIGLDFEIYSGDLDLPKDLDYKELIPPQFMNRHRINSNHEHITFVYFAKSKTDKLNLSEEEKTEACKWFTIEELNDPKYNLKLNVKKYAEAALIKLKDVN